MVKINSVYQGRKHCLSIHQPSQSQLETDAPKDNQGLGEKFSPTDLVATALGTCVLTTMAMVAERDGIDLTGATYEVEKEMTSSPRKIGSLKSVIHMPKSLPEEYRKKMQNTAEACPVKKSLHPDVAIPLEFIYDL